MNTAKYILNSVDAGSFEFLFARLFGERVVYHDGGNLITVAIWRGKIYALQIEPSDR